MQINISKSVPEVYKEKRHWPAVSIIMPFEPIIQRKDDLMMRLQKAMKKVEWEMGTGYDEDLAEPHQRRGIREVDRAGRTEDVELHAEDGEQAGQ